GEARRVTVDRPPLDALRRRLLVYRLAQDVPDAAERRRADGNGDGPAGVEDVDAPRETVGRVHRDGAQPVVAEVLLDLCDQVGLVVAPRDPQRRVDLRQPVREDRVDDDALDLEQLSGVATGAVSGAVLAAAVGGVL